MNDPKPQELVPTLLKLLSPAQRHLAVANLRARLVRGLELTLWSCVAAGAIETISVAVCRVTEVDVPWVCHAAAVMPIVIGILAVSMPPLVALRRFPPSWQQTAERLDSAHDDHNRIATAWSLAEQRQETLFASAAIEQGLARLRVVSEQTPALPSMSGRLGQKLIPGALAIVLAGMAVMSRLLPHWERPALPRVELTSVTTNESDDMGWIDQDGEQARLPSPREHRSPMRSPAKRSRAGDISSASSKRGTGSRDRALPEAEPTTLTWSQRTSGNASSAAGVTGQPHQSFEAQRGSPRSEPRQQTDSRSAPSSRSSGTGQRSSNGTIAGGGAGAGHMVAVQNRWAQREATVGGDVDASEDEREIEEKAAGSRQRGGVQPSLPDRTQAPSRELGITGPKSKRPGTGRGGPSPQKKARGAAALLMGVPLPDFVRGRTGPGAVAITVEDTAPLTSSQGSEPGGPARARSEPESVVSRFEVPWSDAAAVQAYLVGWHGLHETDVAAARADQPLADW